MEESKILTIVQAEDENTDTGQESSEDSTLGSSESITLDTKINGLEIKNSDIIITAGGGGKPIAGGIDKTIYVRSVRYTTVLRAALTATIFLVTTLRITRRSTQQIMVALAVIFTTKAGTLI